MATKVKYKREGKMNERNKFEHIENEIKYETLKQALLMSRMKKYLPTILPVVTIYMLMILSFLLVKNGFNLSFFSSNPESNLKTLQNQVATIEQNLSNLEDSIKATTNSPDTKNLNIRINQLEERQNNIINSIDLDINKALTARLLQEKQKTIDAEISQLQNSQNDLNKRIDGLITTVVAVPLGGVVLSLISAGIIYLFNRSRKK